MIYISYGMPRSASSFCFQIIDALLKAAGHNRWVIANAFLPEELRSNYLWLGNDEIDKLSKLVPDEKILVVKTHSILSGRMEELMNASKVKACATFRDPRDAAISLMEVGEKERQKGQYGRFDQIRNLKDAFNFYKNNKSCFAAWLSHPLVLKISFDLLANDPIEAALTIRDHLMVNVDVKSVVQEFTNDLRGKVWEFNRGEGGRYAEVMGAEQQELFSSEFGDLIDLMNKLDDRYRV